MAFLQFLWIIVGVLGSPESDGNIFINEEDSF